MNLDPERDRDLAEALRRVEGDAQLDDAAWNRLRAGIAARAGRHAARRTEEVTWWECIAGWARAAVPLAAAVGLVFLVLTQREWDAEDPAAADVALEAPAGLAMLLSGEVRGQDEVVAIVGPSDRDWLVDSVIEVPRDE
jgi:hypothetical protein